MTVYTYLYILHFLSTVALSDDKIENGLIDCGLPSGGLMAKAQSSFAEKEMEAYGQERARTQSGLHLSLS
jgi:hypothetical protein